MWGRGTRFVAQGTGLTWGRALMWGRTAAGGRRPGGGVVCNTRLGVQVGIGGKCRGEGGRFGVVGLVVICNGVGEGLEVWPLLMAGEQAVER